MGRHYQTAKYSWYNKTLKEAFFWESKDLLNYQRMNGYECVNVEADRLSSKKEMSKGISKALQNRVFEGIEI